MSPAFTGRIAGNGSERIRLARVALAAALSVPGVARADGGPLALHRTPVGNSAPLVGVICAAAADGGYAVALRLIAGLVPLPALADRITERVSRAAGNSGLARDLQSVSIHFAGIDAGSSAS